YFHPDLLRGRDVDAEAFQLVGGATVHLCGVTSQEANTVREREAERERERNGRCSKNSLMPGLCWCEETSRDESDNPSNTCVRQALRDPPRDLPHRNMEEQTIWCAVALFDRRDESAAQIDHVTS
ncbi:unnamed protein product, partial [Ectocarpus sp. 12 AP-2014]